MDPITLLISALAKGPDVATSTVSLQNIPSTLVMAALATPQDSQMTLPSRNFLGSTENIEASQSVSNSNSQLCLGRACLGMTIQEAVQLPLDEISSFITFIEPSGRGVSGYGINSKGERVWFNQVSQIDNKRIKQYSQSVKTICKVKFFSASMKASDGESISLTFNPMFVNGKGELKLTNITRSLPGTMSDSQIDAFVAQAKERYGAAYYTFNPVGMGPPKGVRATVLGRYLKLDMPTDNDIDVKLMEQSGCSSKTSLD